MGDKNVLNINSMIIEKYGDMYVWKTRVLPYYINDNNEISEHVFIYVQNKITKESKLSVYNEFLVDTYYSNSERKVSAESVRKPASYLCMFLNYIFNDKPNPVCSLKDLTYADVDSFLNQYSSGNIGQDTQGYKDKRTVLEVKRTIDAFGYWLSRVNAKNNNMLAPNFKKKDFSKQTRVMALKYGKTRKVNYYESPFKVKIHGSVEREKVREVDELLFLSILYTANYYDKMLVLPIALQGFAGLREGEVMQMCEERIFIDKPRGELLEFSIDLWQEKLIRDDGKITGHIKIEREQSVYYSFLPILDKLYNEHLQLLKEQGYDNDKYGALFFNNRNQAMLVENYEERFQKIVTKTIPLLSAMSNAGITEATNNLSLLHRAKMTTHCLRYFFTGFITNKCKGNVFEIAAWRGDSSIQSALTYLRKYRPAREKIRETQDEFEKDYEKYSAKIREVTNC